jgi:ATPase family associated with various cellular activities (AAA)
VENFAGKVPGRVNALPRPPKTDQDSRPELADVGRLARRLMRRAVTAARVQDAPARQLLLHHLGPAAADVPVVIGSWPRYDHVNVQAGLDTWLAADGRGHELVGLTGFRDMSFGLADVIQPGRFGADLGVGSVAMTALPSGPGGATRACVECGLYLVDDDGTPLALLMRGPDPHDRWEDARVEVACRDQERARRSIDDIRRLAVERNVFRGQVISFGGEVFGRGRAALLSFLDRPAVDRKDVVLPPEILHGIDDQVLGVARHAERLLASGQHLKRGVLLYGVPGTGKTHTVRYLLSQLHGVTVVILSGAALQFIGEACSVARTLQPSVIVVEDVDLIAEQRDPRMGQHPLLFQLLKEMDGLGGDVDVTFLLTTNRADLLEDALAARPGRVDHAAELPVPDADARRALIRLYQGSLVLDLADPEVAITRTDGVTASFLKELLRRAALVAAKDAQPGDSERGDSAPLVVSDAHMNAALDQLLDTRSQLTRVLLGSRVAGTPARAEPPIGADAVIRKPPEKQ